MTYQEFKQHLEKGFCVQCISDALGVSIDMRKAHYGLLGKCRCCGELHHFVTELPMGIVLWSRIHGKFESAVKQLESDADR